MNLQLGVDKSAWDGTVDWAAAKARGIEWATIRASFGAKEQDELHLSEAANALAAGVHVAPYHWYVPKQGAIAQAEKFLASTKGGDLPPVLDLEDYGLTRGYVGIGRQEIKPWLETVELAAGMRPWVYSSPDYITNYLTADTWISEYPLILANYDASAPFVSKPWTPKGLLAWQFGDGRDAKFYGFLNANGCALYVAYGIAEYVKAWESKAVPPPVNTPAYTHGLVLTTVKVRSGPATAFANVSPYLALAGQTVTVQETQLDAAGNLWIRIGEGLWCASRYQGRVLIELE
jgi:hypothetical protein